MKMKKIVLGMALAIGVVAAAQAADEPVVNTNDQGSGTVTFTGSIIDAPCSLMGEKDQTVYMGQISNVALAKSGKSPAVDFSIDLEKCIVSEKAKSVSVTFTGPKGTITDSLGMGKVSGASIILSDGNNKKIKLGEATDLQTLANGSNKLSFSAYVQGNGGDAAIDLGEFKSTAGFTLAYQ